MKLAIANQKGGVAKTTSAVTIAHGLARAGHQVLLVDLDPQGHAAVSLGLEKAPGLYRLIVSNEPLDDVIVNARPNLDVIPGDKRTENAKRYVSSLDFRETVLINLLGSAERSYDAIILDLAPSFDVLHVAALAFADHIIIPAKLDHLAIDGINEIVRSMAELSRHGHGFSGFHILPTFFDRTTKETTLKFREMADMFGGRLWPPIPRDTKTREATRYGQTVWEYAPTSPVVVGYSRNGQRVGGYADILKRIQQEVMQ